MRSKPNEYERFVCALDSDEDSQFAKCNEFLRLVIRLVL